MGRNRAQFSAPSKDSRTPTLVSSPKNDRSPIPQPKPDSSPDSVTHDEPLNNSNTSTAVPSPADEKVEDVLDLPLIPKSPSPKLNSSSPSPAGGRPRSNSRPLSIVQTYQPPLMDITQETLPELQPIFTLLNSHSNKLYQEGYFLKLDDQDIKGKPNPDRTWTECFAQLVGTVLSLWDAAELDVAGEDGEVLPKFINLTDASIKMIESLPTRTPDEQPLQNILSISTAGRNRYLLHFNSHNSLVQWTSGIRLAMFEHSTLQEAYTGALIAGKGKRLNSINIIMEPAKAPVQEWVRVRFGAGVPWRRCWCVIEPPSLKEIQKAQKDLKKRSPYDRSQAPILKGEIRFYDNKKEAEKKKKHQRPIASITDAYSAYAIYPQSKALIDGSTLLKIEGDITIHSDPPSSTEGFVFIMPESHPMVTGMEMLLRFLFPTWDTFGLYGRPGRLVASALDSRSLMFAMPKHKRYGYLEILDVSGLISENGSPSWSEREWRKRLKELTGQRMNAMEEGGGNHSRSASRSSKRLSTSNPAAPKGRVGFADDGSSGRSSRSMSVTQPGARTDSAPPDANRERSANALPNHSNHSRAISDTQLTNAAPYHYDMDNSSSMPSAIRHSDRARTFASDLAPTPERVSSEDESPRSMEPATHLEELQRMETPEPVNPPPAFAHEAGSRPQQKPYPSPEMRRANNRLSHATLSQMAKTGNLAPDAYSYEHQYGDSNAGPGPGYNNPRGQPVQTNTSANAMGINANFFGSPEALTPPSSFQPSHSFPGPIPSRLDSAENRISSPLKNPPSVPGGRRTPPNSGIKSAPIPQPGSPPVHRKPVPSRAGTLQQESEKAISPIPAQFPRDGGLNARFDDASSTTTPDYASTRPSIDTQSSVDRPRAGVLKSTAEDQALEHKGSSNDDDYSIPPINFGPTLNYGALPPSKTIPNTATDTNSSAQSSRPTPGRKSSGSGSGLSHFRQESGDTLRRSIPWQPGTIAGSLSSGDNAVSPEQFVQQRASVVFPMYTHQRTPSGNTLAEFRSRTPTSPPHKRPGGASAGHSRSNSADMLTSGRPLSQGSAAVLSGGELSSHLSAREQEHVARVTGSPLIAWAGNKSQPQPQAGLVGAIEARERERAQMRQGIGGQAVAQAIDQRHREQNQQAQRAAAFAQQQSQHTHQSHTMVGSVSPMAMDPRNMNPNSGFTSPRLGPGFQPAPGYGSPQARPHMMNNQQQGGPHIPQNFGQGSIWTMPNIGLVSTGYQVPPHSQYSPAGTPGTVRPGTPGRMQYQNHAF
ncbi:hypothetical protein QBC38DRAFT_455738 [Podospora fimiseda]|uniref:PH domain-containing protein n=1 Tax=Podospora fimiseda TaxID=252190 RepID=A0AAN7BP09_9PEZI|nr:hypothetical protein QBC38DRAFT_455738 [Podospora fimiseda]